MAGRKIRDAADARACLAAAKAQRGMSRARWAREHGIDGRSLNAWRVNLERGSAARPKRTPLRLVELVPSARVAAARYVVRCGQLAIELDEHFDEATLRRLLRVVAAC
jgi:transposase-like protein